MKIIYSELEKLYHPKHRLTLGELIHLVVKNNRAEIIKKEAKKRGLKSLIINPNEYPLEFIKTITDSDMVDFVKSCENFKKNEAAYPYVFPYRRRLTRKFDDPTEVNTKSVGYYSFDMVREIDNNTYKAAKLAADCALTGAELILNKKERNVFALCCPPGHHAGYNYYGGFCVFNNAAIAAYQLLKRGKVAILDLDFHHGNGTQDIFYEQASVLFVSLHGDPHHYYPYFSGYSNETGHKLGAGTNINIPLPGGTANNQYREHLKDAIKKIGDFQPETLVLSMGFDTYKHDYLGAFNLTTDFYKEIALLAGELKIPILAVLEGGYNIMATGKNGYSFIEGLAELD
jgi:acetoin utilization deacetylase AcuC-like enzyme